MNKRQCIRNFKSLVKKGNVLYVEEKEYGHYVENKKYGRYVENKEYGRYAENKEYGRYPENKEYGRYAENKEYGRYPENKEYGRYPENKEYGRYPENKEYGRYPENKEYGQYPEKEKNGLFPTEMASKGGRENYLSYQTFYLFSKGKNVDMLKLGKSMRTMKPSMYHNMFVLIGRNLELKNLPLVLEKHNTNKIIRSCYSSVHGENSNRRKNKHIWSNYNFTDMIKTNLKNYIILSRMHIPTGFYLLFYSALYGYILTYDMNNLIIHINNNYELRWEAIKEIGNNIALFLIGSINSRIVGCIINDLFDRKFDKHVERTKNRPLANETMSIRTAITYMCIHGCISLLTLFQFDYQTVCTGLISTIFIITYPLLKRITYYAQVYLSFTFNLGFFISSSININLVENILPLTLSFLPLCYLTIIYDTIYAYQDKQDDIKLNLRSLAIKWNKNTLKNSKLLAIHMTYLFYLSAYLFNIHYSYYILSTCNVLYLYHSISNISIDDKKECMDFFKKSKYFLLLIALSALFAKMCELHKKELHREGDGIQVGVEA
ncbi:para-hydroxybenzoate--polyprenyltransferase, putative [Plasmodium malariae]|uniref:Para-hydroxybenzoate--polyprenyltransferase, putative n=1 Tax=Plasmodium malariae TaxID=5858 RepID=A0A1C3L023_PLAMA|nr:para-hydroxybenzoate--polyprenyltransferase, putative [Plasmodium malariae]